MPDEKKTYLVNVESNLDQYAKEAEEAGKNVDELTAAHIRLKGSGKASNEELQKSAAAIRVAKKEYTDSKKVLDVYTSALNSETGSRKQLGEVLRLQQQALGKLGNAYIQDEKGLRKLNPLYIEQTKRIKETKNAIIEYDKAQLDGRSSVGLYSEAIEGSAAQFQAIPGPIGRAGQAISRYSKLLLANPIILIIAGITAALAGLLKIIKTTDSGATEMAARMEQLRVILDVIRQRVLAFIDGIKALINLDWETLRNKMADSFGGMGKQIKEATQAAYDYIQMLDTISNAEQNYISESAENRKEIARLELMAQDLTIPVARRKAALQLAIKIGEEELEAQKKFAQDRFTAAVVAQAKINGLTTKELIAFTRMTDAEQANASEALKTWRDNNEDKAVELENLYANWLDLDTKFFTEQKRNVAKLSSFELQQQKAVADDKKKKLDEAKKAADEALKEAEKARAELIKQLLEEAKMIEEMQKEDADAITKKKKDAEDLADWERNRKQIDFENDLAVREMQNENIFALERERLDNERLLELEFAEKTGADILLINQKYVEYKKLLDEEEKDAKLALWRGMAANLAIIFGKSSAVGKAAAIAATTIATYEAAMQAYKSMAGLPLIGQIAAGISMAAAIATGVASVKKILAVKSGLPGDTGGGGSIPTAITTTPMAQRTFATPVASSFITQQQLTQTELNAAQQGNLLTAADIAEAIMNLPPPIVTVEDINAKAESKRKVEVRATI